MEQPKVENQMEQHKVENQMEQHKVENMDPMTLQPKVESPVQPLTTKNPVQL
jgi:hypothetical protein